MLLLVEVNIPFLHSFNTLCVREIRNRKQKEIDSVILLIDYSKFCLFYNVKVFEKMYFRNFMDFLDFGFFLIFWDFLGFLGFFGIFSKKSEGVRGFFRVDNPSKPHYHSLLSEREKFKLLNEFNSVYKVNPQG